MINNKKTGRIFSASLTLEAAVIIPLAVGFFVTILMFLRIIQIQGAVQEALIYTCRKTAASTLAESSIGSTISCETRMRKCLNHEEPVEKYVKGGRSGIRLTQSDTSGEFVTLHAAYFVNLPVGFFHMKGIPMEQTASSRKWIGMNPEQKGRGESYVYVTEYGTVYHTSKNCSVLDLSVRSCNPIEISSLRNKNGHKYYECNQCADSKADMQILYITDYGTSYHTNPSCSSLKRTVYQIPLSEVGGRQKCKKCGGLNGNSQMDSIISQFGNKQY